MTSTLALKLATSAWTTEKTKQHFMDPILAEAFAEILDNIIAMGLTGELADYIKDIDSYGEYHEYDKSLS